MRSFWVSRAEFDKAVAVGQSAINNAAQAEALLERAMSRIENLLERLTDYDRRYDALLEKFTALRLQGAVEVPKVVAAEPVKHVEEDPLKAAINAKFAGLPSKMRAAAMRQLQSDRSRHVPDDDILAQIETGFTQSDGIP